MYSYIVGKSYTYMYVYIKMATQSSRYSDCNTCQNTEEYLFDSQQGQQVFFLSKTSRRLRDCLPAVQQLEHEANYSSPYSAEVKERVELYLRITVCFHTLPRDSSAFQISALGFTCISAFLFEFVTVTNILSDLLQITAYGRIILYKSIELILYQPAGQIQSRLMAEGTGRGLT